MILFGASPVLDKAFLRGQPHRLDELSPDTLYLPYATSLRMSDLGYQNDAQNGLIPPYNTMMDYMRSLAQAVRKPHAPYAELGMQRNGEWWQINTNVLQIENEYYATIRPKRVIRTGERPLEALCARGIQYIEVRCMDADPFNPVGISLETARFLDAFLLFCALDDSPQTNAAIGEENAQNFAKTVKEGRRPGLQLQDGGQSRSLTEWGESLLDRIAIVAKSLDDQCDDQCDAQREGQQDAPHTESLTQQRAKLQDLSRTPSAKVLAAVKASGGSYAQWGLATARHHAQSLQSRPLTAAQIAEFQALAQASWADQATMEASQTGSFDDFIADYRSRTPSELCDGVGVQG
jgi:glutamate--cysteine ligase